MPIQSRVPLPSSFDMLIDDLFRLDDRPAGAPKPPPFSINSLEAAWELAANSRGVRAYDVVAPSPPNYYATDGSDTDAQSFLDPNKILLELGLNSNFSEADVATLRREFALRNHPDRVPTELQSLATERMMLANDLMDRYVARLRKSGS
jgi:hypothetical protein